MHQLVLDRRYDPKQYPIYDNYAAIEVSETKNIPIDYFGLMGVPITALAKGIDLLFEILFISPEIPGLDGKLKLNGKELYRRIIIRRKRIWEDVYSCKDVAGAADQEPALSQCTNG